VNEIALSFIALGVMAVAVLASLACVVFVLHKLPTNNLTLLHDVMANYVSAIERGIAIAEQRRSMGSNWTSTPPPIVTPEGPPDLEDQPVEIGRNP
jgi:hypothetical protein